MADSTNCPAGPASVAGARFTVSPWAYGKKVFCLDEEGDTMVVCAGPEFELPHTNSLEEMCMASPAVARGSLFILHDVACAHRAIRDHEVSARSRGSMRVHLFEFNDQPWLPAVFRNALTGYLRTLSRVFRLDERLAPLVARVLADTGEHRIIDLCSGSGGPILEIRGRLPHCPPVVLTDAFPNRTLPAAALGNGVTALLEPIDATAVPPHLTGLRTVINAFHHFRPADARRVLSDAVAQRAPILIIELSARTLPNVLLSPLIIPIVLVLMPLVRPMRWEYWVFCYLVPVLPLMVFWDGLVSHLRCYSRAELAALAATVAPSAHAWHTESLPVGAGLRATVLVGSLRAG